MYLPDGDVLREGGTTSAVREAAVSVRGIHTARVIRGEVTALITADVTAPGTASVAAPAAASVTAPFTAPVAAPSL